MTWHFQAKQGTLVFSHGHAFVLMFFKYNFHFGIS